MGLQPAFINRLGFWADIFYGGNFSCLFLSYPEGNYPCKVNLKSKFRAKFSDICCIFSHEASISGYCSRELKRNSGLLSCLSCRGSKHDALFHTSDQTTRDNYKYLELLFNPFSNQKNTFI